MLSISFPFCLVTVRQGDARSHDQIFLQLAIGLIREVKISPFPFGNRSNATCTILDFTAFINQ